jgi:DNA-binding NarL/FixJ family response regulator
MNVFLLSTDLFYASQLQGVIQRLGLNFVQAGTPAGLLNPPSNADESVVLIDLTTPHLDLENLVARLREAPVAMKAVVAYAPHVATAKLAAARAAGCDHVLTRGQAQREIERILRDYLADS